MTAGEGEAVGEGVPVLECVGEQERLGVAEGNAVRMPLEAEIHRKNPPGPRTLFTRTSSALLPFLKPMPGPKEKGKGPELEEEPKEATRALLR